ncbi:hypothetical protein [Pseudomonas huaxiensis]|uniref:hypothetical protein n=1 Tax=Pseudomonas huaxiensis TaxID=2213017 RepID=UPI000DA6C252|nr:hypothetical protein [Pseudomonas huaxiensis]
MKFEPLVFAVVPPVIVPPDDDAVAAYAAMDKEVVALASSTELGDPILPCQQPCIEVTVMGEDNAPLADTPYKLLLEGSLLAEGTLDSTGFVTLDKQELPAGDWNIEITLQRNESTQAVERADILLTATPPATEEAEEDEGEIEEERWPPFLEPPYAWR